MPTRRACTRSRQRPAGASGLCRIRARSVKSSWRPSWPGRRPTDDRIARPVHWLAVNVADKVRALGDNLAINPLNPKDLLKSFGEFGLYLIMFAETGLMVGFFLPGDSLLFLAGVAASPVAVEIVGVHLSLAGLLIGAPICAIAGAQVGHLLGARYGRRLFERPDSRLFRREYVEKAEHYFDKFGPAKAVILARFIPVVRTFLNPVAGVLEMPARQFLLWNVVGGVLWTDGVLLAGYALARQ